MKFTPLAQFTGLFSGIMRKILPDRWFSSSWFTLGRQQALWIDEEKLWQAYERIPHLNAVINTRAELLSQGKIRLRNKKDKSEVHTHPFLKLMSKPNPLQAGPEFLTMYLTYKDVYGNALIYKNKPTSLSKLPLYLWNLPPELMQVIPTGKLFDQVDLEGIIKEFKIFYAGSYTKFETKQIIFKNDNLSATYVKGESKIKALVMPLSNIVAALRTANVLIGDHGTYGIISASKSDSLGGAIPFAGKEKNEVEETMNRNYGNKAGQKQMIVSSSTLTYTPIGSPLREMMLPEEIEQDFGIILSTYRVDRDIFPSVKGATNENKTAGIKATIQNTIQAEADDLATALMNDPDFASLEFEGLEIYITFDHLPVMQEDEEKKSKVIVNTVDAITKSVASGILSPAQGQQILLQLAPIIKIDEALGKPNDTWYLFTDQNKDKSALDSLGKIPLAIQQLALARERANTANDAALSEQIRQAMDQLTVELVNSIVNPPKPTA